MLVIRGVNVFPSEIEAVVLSSPELAPHYTIVVDSTHSLPEMVVVCERARDGAGAEATTPSTDSDPLSHELSSRLSARLGVSGRVVVGPPGAVPRSEVGKAVRLVRLTPESDGRSPELARLMDSGRSAGAGAATAETPITRRDN